MKLYLQRHCQPTLGMPMDAARPLTDEGKRQAAEMAAFMVRHIGRVDIVISSPFVRAFETAQIMAPALGSHIATTTALQPDGKPPAMWAEIERLAPQAKDVLVIGHDPSINELLMWLMGAEDGGKDEIRFEHGAIAHLKVLGGSGLEVNGKLHWFVDVKIVERDVLQDEVVEAAQALVDSLVAVE